MKKTTILSIVVLLIVSVSSISYSVLLLYLYLQPIITQYFASNKSEIWP